MSRSVSPWRLVPASGRLVPRWRNGPSRRFLVPWLLGIAGAGSMLLQVPPPAVVGDAPPVLAASPLAQRALLALPPLVVVTLAALAGATWAHRVGLGSVLAGTRGFASRRAFATILGKAALAGMLMGAAIVAVDVALSGHPGATSSPTPTAAAATRAVSAVGVLYGGLAEEVPMRWGLMATLTLALATLAPRWLAASATNVDRPLVAIDVVLTSVAFAAAHLPALTAAVATPTAADVLRVLALNTAAGIVYGMRAWRHGLEAAMVAHAATHVGRFAAQRAWG